MKARQDGPTISNSSAILMKFVSCHFNGSWNFLPFVTSLKGVEANNNRNHVANDCNCLGVHVSRSQFWYKKTSMEEVMEETTTANLSD